MNPYWFVVAFTLVTQFCVFLRWLHRRIRDSEIERAFVRDLANVHLPHIYQVLHLIAARLGIILEEHPPVRLPDLRDSVPRENGAFVARDD